MKVWITRWALTVGILEAEADSEINDDGVELYRMPVSPQWSPGGKSPLWVRKGLDAFDTLKAAQVDARARFEQDAITLYNAYQEAKQKALRAQQEPVQVFPLEGGERNQRRPFP